MLLTIKEAAAQAKMPTDELLRYIERNELSAEWNSEDEQYNISQDDLDTFLSKKSFEAFWNDSTEAENEAVELQPFANSGNLRRVLTAEAVAELKIEHRVLMSRVETLERLFSEFMELEKAGKALILEDSWKIAPTVGKEKPGAVVSGNALSGIQNEEIITNNHNIPTTNMREMDPVEDLIEAQVDRDGDEKSSVESSTQVKNDTSEYQTISEEKTTSDTSQNLEKENAYMPDLTVNKQQSAKALLSKKLINKSESMLARDDSRKNATTNTNMQADIELGSSITLRLAEYERRLAEAKQTATKIWH